MIILIVHFCLLVRYILLCRCRPSSISISRKVQRYNLWNSKLHDIILTVVCTTLLILHYHVILSIEPTIGTIRYYRTNVVLLYVYS